MGNLFAKMVFKKKKEVLLDIPTSFFNLQAIDIDGNMLNFDSLKYDGVNPKGKKGFLIVNVACD